MRIIPVIDIKAGVAVHAVAGQRDRYQPVSSRLTSSSDPEDLARAYRNILGLAELYVADLDAISGLPPAMGLYGRLASLGLEILLDAGLRDLGSLESVASAPVGAFIVGLESVAGPAALAQMLELLGPRRILFSLDLKDRRPLGDLRGWKAPDAMGIAREALDLGIARMIVIDLAQVGMGRGTGTEELSRRILAARPGLELLAGGGVRSLEDLDVLDSLGVAGVLLATVLHDGRVGPETIRAMSDSRRSHKEAQGL